MMMMKDIQRYSRSSKKMKSFYRTTKYSYQYLLRFAAHYFKLKPNLEIVNVILSIPITNDGEHHKDNNDNAIKYLESNKDNLLDLAENNYEDLVEVLTNNAINAAAS
jgi:hypothetical protein